jgi:hypothetical protein
MHATPRQGSREITQLTILVIYIAAFILFAVAQVVFFLASQPICNVRLPLKS